MLWYSFDFNLHVQEEYMGFWYWAFFEDSKLNLKLLLDLLSHGSLVRGGRLNKGVYSSPE